MGITELTMMEAVLIAVCGFVTVFLMLACLWLIIVIISKVVLKITKAPAAVSAPAPKAPAAAPKAPAAPAPVQLTGVDDLTAACIMAIVSDETGIPLSELVFKQIKAL